MTSTSGNLSNVTTLALLLAGAFVVYELSKAASAVAATAQGVTDWFTGDAVYNSDGERIPLSADAQSVLNAANIVPTGVITSTTGQALSSSGTQNLVSVYDMSTGGTMYVDPNTGFGVT